MQKKGTYNRASIRIFLKFLQGDEALTCGFKIQRARRDTLARLNFSVPGERYKRGFLLRFYFARGFVILKNMRDSVLIRAIYLLNFYVKNNFLNHSFDHFTSFFY